MVNPDIWKHGFGQRPREVDDEYRARAKGVPKWTKAKCINELNDLLDILKKILKDTAKIEVDKKKLKFETIRDTNILINRIMDYMKYLYPPVQTNVNVNIESTAERVIERLKEWKMKKGEIIVGEDA